MNRILLLASFAATSAMADTVVLKSGEQVKGVVQRMERGRITLDVDGKTRSVDIPNVDHIEFDTPHLTEAAGKMPAAHVEGELDPREMTKIAQELRAARQETQATLNQIKGRWQGRKDVDRNEAARWAAEKERFSAPLARYRAALDELYLHVAAQVDGYNRLAQEANGVYMGVRGLLNVGSPLVPEDKKALDAKEVLPRGWWDRIFYEGYSKGFKDAKEYDRLTPQ